jgi:hypothetical protein
MKVARLLLALVLIAVGAGLGCGPKLGTVTPDDQAKTTRKMVLDLAKTAKKGTPAEVASLGTDVLASLKHHQKTAPAAYSETYTELTKKCEDVIEEGRRSKKATPAFNKLITEMVTLSKKLPE